MLKSMDTEKRGPKTCQNRQNITKTVTKIDPKSAKSPPKFTTNQSNHQDHHQHRPQVTEITTKIHPKS